MSDDGCQECSAFLNPKRIKKGLDKKGKPQDSSLSTARENCQRILKILILKDVVKKSFGFLVKSNSRF
jgi:hypothetical protein